MVVVGVPPMLRWTPVLPPVALPVEPVPAWAETLPASSVVAKTTPLITNRVTLVIYALSDLRIAAHRDGQALPASVIGPDTASFGSWPCPICN